MNLAKKQKKQKQKYPPAGPTKTVLMSIFFFYVFLVLSRFLTFVQCISSYFHLFKCRNILAIFKILWLLLSQMTKMALRYYTSSSYWVRHTIFSPAPAVVLITKREATTDAPSAATPCYLLIYSTKNSFKWNKHQNVVVERCGVSKCGYFF